MWDYAIQSTQFRTIMIRKEFVNREKYQFEEYNYTNHPLYKVIQTGRRMENQSKKSQNNKYGVFSGVCPERLVHCQNTHGIL